MYIVTQEPRKGLDLPKSTMLIPRSDCQITMLEPQIQRCFTFSASVICRFILLVFRVAYNHQVSTQHLHTYMSVLKFIAVILLKFGKASSVTWYRLHWCSSPKKDSSARELEWLLLSY